MPDKNLKLTTNRTFLFRNSKASMWSPAKGKRFKVVDNKSHMPNMCTYNASDLDSTHGIGYYVVSKYRTMGTKRMHQNSPRGKA